MDDRYSASKTPEEIIRDERVLDNVLVSVFFDPESSEAKDCLEENLRIFLEDPDLVVETFHAEHVLTNIGNHSVRIDVFAKAGDGRHIAVELQKVTTEELFRRAVAEASSMVVHSLPASEEYAEVADVVVIYITEKDIKGEGLPFYKYWTKRDSKEDDLMDGAPVYLFVNGKYRDNSTAIGRAIHDVLEPDPQRMYSETMRKRMNRLKNTTEGRKKLSAALESYVERRSEKLQAAAVRKNNIQIARKLIELGTYDDSRIAEITGLLEEEIKGFRSKYQHRLP